MSRIPFAKVESIGNDFVLIEADAVSSDLLPAFAQKVCSRRFSVGSDGLLVVGRHGDDLTQRMFNPDGTEDFCGNGLRCVAWYAHLNGWISGPTTIHHLGRLVPIEVHSDGLIETEIGLASYLSAEVPHTLVGELFDSELEVLGRKVVLSSLTTGSTHTIIFVDELPNDEELNSVGPALEHHPIFPERTSVIWTKVVSPDHLAIRIWERGAGETLGCGTGSSAAAANYFRKHQRGGTVRVENRGGSVEVSMESWYAPITVKGRAEMVYRGTVEF